MRHGNGVQVYADGVAKYAGTWHFDQRNGDGRQVFADGSEYQGNFNFGVFHGYGRFSWPKEPTGSAHTDLHCGHTY